MTYLNYKMVYDSFSEHIYEEKIYPNIDDTLFWCLFMHVNTECVLNKNNEIDEKIVIVDYMQKNKNWLKKMDNKITLKKAEEIKSILLSEKTTLLVMYALSYYYDINVLIVYKKNKTFIEYNEKSTNTCIIFKNSPLMMENNKCKYSIPSYYDKNEINDIKTNYYKFEYFDKPLLNLSKYTLLCLRNICIKRFIFISNTDKKKDIYDILLNNITC